MRLDKYLKVSRLIKRRPVANEVCARGRVKVNGRVAKPGTDIKAGDELEIGFGTGPVRILVLATPETVRKESAEDLYKLLGKGSDAGN